MKYVIVFLALAIIAFVPIIHIPVSAQDDLFSLYRDCDKGMFVAYKIDNSKSACVHPETLRELVSRGWAFPQLPWFVEGRSQLNN